MTYFETNHKPDTTTTVDLTKRDFKSLRRARPEEVGKIPACLTVLRDGVVWVYRHASGESQKLPKPNGLNGGGLPKQTATVIQPEIGPIRHAPIRITAIEGQPWARRSLAAGRPMGPGRHSGRNVGR